MKKQTRKEMDTWKDADNKKWLRIDRKAEEEEMHSFMRKMYKRISNLKIQLEQLDFNKFDGSYEEFARVKRRLELEIQQEESKFSYIEDMKDMYEKEIPVSADDYNTGNVSDEVTEYKLSYYKNSY